MAIVTYIQPDGTSRKCVNFEGMTVMHLAVGNLVDGIDALCGGVRQCGTCHCYIAEEWWDKVGPPGDDEAAMLEALEVYRAGSLADSTPFVKKAFAGEAIVGSCAK